MSNSEYFALNRAGWDHRVGVHLTSNFYDVAGFLNGASSLREIERRELTDVAGKRLLHLQCHFGLDTLSWARRGAICTGVDLSPVAIREAQRLAQEAGLDAEFICSNVYDLATEAPLYDLVYTSYGVVCWLPDLTLWAEVIAANLKPGGTFYMVEFHPVQDLLSGYAYFPQAAPDLDTEGTYTDGGEDTEQTFAVWSHPLAAVVTALLDAGLHLQHLHEFPYSPYDCFEGLVEREPGRFYRTHESHDVPMTYSLRACKPA